MRARAAALTLLSTTLAGAGAAMAQDGPRAFACSFPAGTTLAYAQGSYTSTPAQPLGFDIAAIDFEGQSATLLTAKGEGVLRIVRAINANHYLEVVTEGFLNVTTIYDNDAKVGAHPAVHSRHFGLFGEPVVAQYRGFCKAK